jgi:hypothetical protein
VSRAREHGSLQPTHRDGIPSLQALTVHTFKPHIVLEVNGDDVDNAFITNDTAVALLHVKATSGSVRLVLLTWLIDFGVLKTAFSLRSPVKNICQDVFPPILLNILPPKFNSAKFI